MARVARGGHGRKIGFARTPGRGDQMFAAAISTKPILSALQRYGEFLLGKANDPESAFDYFVQASQVSPHYPDPHYYMAAIQKEKRAYNKAYASYSRYIDLRERVEFPEHHDSGMLLEALSFCAAHQSMHPETVFAFDASQKLETLVQKNAPAWQNEHGKIPFTIAPTTPSSSAMKKATQLFHTMEKNNPDFPRYGKIISTPWKNSPPDTPSPQKFSTLWKTFSTPWKTSPPPNPEPRTPPPDWHSEPHARLLNRRRQIHRPRRRRRTSPHTRRRWRANPRHRRGIHPPRPRPRLRPGRNPPPPPRPRPPRRRQLQNPHFH